MGLSCKIVNEDYTKGLTKSVLSLLETRKQIISFS